MHAASLPADARHEWLLCLADPMHTARAPHADTLARRCLIDTEGCCHRASRDDLRECNQPLWAEATALAKSAPTQVDLVNPAPTPSEPSLKGVEESRPALFGPD